jgi:hypothetical protein
MDLSHSLGWPVDEASSMGNLNHDTISAENNKSKHELFTSFQAQLKGTVSPV